MPKRPKPKKSLPRLAAILTCDAFSRDPTSEKLSLYGLFDAFWVEKIPGSVKPFVLYAKLLGGSGAHKLNVSAIGPDGRNITDAPSTIDATFSSNASIELCVQFGNVAVKKLGAMHFVIKIDGKAIGQPHAVRVTRRNK